MSRSLVLVSQRVDHVPTRSETRDALDRRLSAWMCGAGLLAAPVSNAYAVSDLMRYLELLTPAGIVLSGGNNIGEEPERDRTERGLLDYAEQHRLPVLGICRGMQMMGVHAGAALVPVHGHVRTRHSPLVLDDNSDGSWPEEVNSYHDIGLAECPDNYHVVVRSTDGGIEAMRHRTLPWEGWMWHPEREPIANPRDIVRLENLFCRS